MEICINNELVQILFHQLGIQRDLVPKCNSIPFCSNSESPLMHPLVLHGRFTFRTESQKRQQGEGGTIHLVPQLFL